MSELPKGWITADIEEVLAIQQDGKKIHQGWSPQCEKQPCDLPSEWGVLKTTAIQAGDFQWQHHKKLPQHLESRPSIEIAVGDLLLTCAGPRARCGVACLVRSVRPRLMLSGKIYRFRAATEVIDERYLEAFLQTQEAQLQIDEMKTGGSDSGLNLTHERFKRLRVYVAPRSEQTRIVAKIEELLSDLNAGIAELEAAKKKLTRYRQSLLKAALEGALTSELRAAHKNKETGVQLLERILSERRTRWEAKQLAKFTELGKTPSKDWQQKYLEPIKPDVANLPELPDGWVWATAEQLCEFITKGTTPPKELDAGKEKTIPFLRVTNLTETGLLDLTDKVYVSEETHKGFLARSAVFPNDILMNIVGPPLGQVSVVPNLYPEWNVNQAVAIFRAVDGIAPEFIRTCLLSPFAQRWLKARSKTTAGQTNLTLQVCRELPFPLPPLHEQRELVSRLDEALAAMNLQTEAIEKNVKQSTLQRQNILKAAFSGELTQQDPSEESASVLLERIRAERTAKASRSTKRIYKHEVLKGSA